MAKSTVNQRIQEYLREAQGAEAQAAKCTDASTAEAFNKIAAHWRELARLAQGSRQ
jgi:hypothetical protein